MVERVRIEDTTLRDGEQAPGFSLAPAEKLKFALQLDRLGVDRIEAGFPAASESEFHAVKEISAVIEHADVAALARATTADLEMTAKALERAKRPVIQTFVSTSDLHLQEKLGWSRQQAIDVAVKATERAKQLVGTVSFGMEDASRSDPDYLCQVIQAVVDAGAETVNIADTVGYILPDEWVRLVKKVLTDVRGMDKTILSVHCHDDLGMAVANSIAALSAGARQVDCTINGIGERAGNASLEEIVMLLNVRDIGLTTGVDSKQIHQTSRLLSILTGVDVPPNKAIVGKNAFAHEAGIHQAGVLKNPLTYEIMSPESIGLSGRSLVLGKHSGRHGIGARLTELGLDVSPTELDRIYERFLAIADKKKVVVDDDLLAIAGRSLDTSDAAYELISVQYVRSGTNATSTVTIKANGETRVDSAVGKGPFEASAAAINRLVGYEFRTEDVEVSTNTRGRDSLANAVAKISDETRKIFTGRHTGVDVIEVCATAYLNAVNAAVRARGTAQFPKRGSIAPPSLEPPAEAVAQ